jgi:hypothetical protein
VRILTYRPENYGPFCQQKERHRGKVQPPGQRWPVSVDLGTRPYLLLSVYVHQKTSSKGIATRNEVYMEIPGPNGVQTLYTVLVWSYLCVILDKTPYPRVRTALRSHPRGSPHMSDRLCGAYKNAGRTLATSIWLIIINCGLRNSLVRPLSSEPHLSGTEPQRGTEAGASVEALWRKYNYVR